MGQEFFLVKEDCEDLRRCYADLERFIEKNYLENIFLVCGNSMKRLRIAGYILDLEKRKKIRIVKFSHFEPNPRYESVIEGVELFQREKCDSVFAVGGGSAMDVAKCIKLYSGSDTGKELPGQKPVPGDLPFLVVPTTAGTGLESTSFVVIYQQGEKKSLTDESLLPAAVIFDSQTLKSLPEYQRKAAMLDAVCHDMESLWSIHSTQKSRGYARESLRMILKYKASYLSNEDGGNEHMLKAANLAGRAINISKTTAGHAMCYKLTGLYGIAHGHSAALCVEKLFPYMLTHMERCVDPRGAAQLQDVFKEIAELFGCKNGMEAAASFADLLEGFHLQGPVPKEQDYKVLTESVNLERLKNNPVSLDGEAIESLYWEILLNF